MRVLIVDDSAFMRKVIKQMIEAEPSLEVAGLARDGEHAIELAKQLKPDLITLDIEMPRKDGIEALREIRLVCRDTNPAVLMCSSLTVAGSSVALKALKAGASDVIAKDPDKVGQKDEAFRVELIHKLTALAEHRARLRGNSNTPESEQAGPVDTHGVSLPKRADEFELAVDPKVIVIGSSTGGPPVLETVVSSLPAAFGVPIVIAQHMPQVFTHSLAKRLNEHAACKVMLANKGTALDPGTVYLAEGGHHICFTKIPSGRVVTRYVEEQPGAIYKPSVDLLFSSATRMYGGNVLALQLTGMGEDGVEGAQEIVNAGGQVLAQDERSCVVFGMPGAVVARKLASAAMPPSELVRVLGQYFRSHRNGTDKICA